MNPIANSIRRPFQPLCHADSDGHGLRNGVYLPRVEQAAQPGKREGEEEVCSGSETILLAEDSDPLREMAREYLESVGYTVLEAASGKDAL